MNSGPGSNTKPCSENFSGSFAHSESEVKAIADFILDHGNFKAMVTIHSYSHKLMYPYGHSYSPVPNAEELVSNVSQSSTFYRLAVWPQLKADWIIFF